MITIWILTARTFAGFAVMPLATEADCRAALAALPPSIVWAGECTQIAVAVPSSPLAPEMAPIPPIKEDRQ